MFEKLLEKNVDIQQCRDGGLWRGLKSIVVGRGEVGTAVWRLVKEYYTVDTYDIEDGVLPETNYDVMHVCFPYGLNFVSEVVKYADRFLPKLILVESTVKPGTTALISHQLPHVLVCHSPVRGRLRDTFAWALLAYTKFIGPCSVDAGTAASRYYQYLKMKTRICEKPEDTEWMKLLNTTYWGLLVGWFQDCERIAYTFNLDLKEIINFFTTTQLESGGNIPRPTLWVGPMGGHCIIPNARLMLSVYDSNFAEDVVRSQLTFESSMQSLFNLGQKEGCPLCGRIYTREIYRNESNEPYFIISCLTCRDPLVIFREHKVAKEAVEDAVKAVTKLFPDHTVVDTHMGAIPNHVHFHLRKHLSPLTGLNENSTRGGR